MRGDSREDHRRPGGVRRFAVSPFARLVHRAVGSDSGKHPGRESRSLGLRRDAVHLLCEVRFSQLARSVPSGLEHPGGGAGRSDRASRLVHERRNAVRSASTRNLGAAGGSTSPSGSLRTERWSAPGDRGVTPTGADRASDRGRPSPGRGSRHLFCGAGRRPSPATAFTSRLLEGGRNEPAPRSSLSLRTARASLRTAMALTCLVVSPGRQA